MNEIKPNAVPGAPPPGWTPPMADISWVRRKYLDIPYAMQSPNQRLDIYLPLEGEGPFPLLIHVHGGGFAFGDKRDDHMNAYLKALHWGWAAASIEYRLSGEAAFPAAVLDCRSAVRFLRANAWKYGLDTNRFAAIDGSAGGNLAAMLGMNVPNGAFPGEDPDGEYAAEPFVRAAVAQFGPMDFRTMDEQARRNGVSNVDHDEPFSPESRYLGCPIPDAPAELCAAASPATYAGPDMCPMYVQHGTHDRLVPFEQSVEFVQALRAKGLGGRVSFESLEGADHEDKLFFTDENLGKVRAFLESVMGEEE